MLPDVPQDVHLHIQRNRYVSMEAAHKLERERRRKSRQTAEGVYEKDGSLTVPDVRGLNVSARHREGKGSAVSPEEKSPSSSYYATSDDDSVKSGESRDPGKIGKLIDLFEHH